MRKLKLNFATIRRIFSSSSSSPNYAFSRIHRASERARPDDKSVQFRKNNPHLNIQLSLTVLISSTTTTSDPFTSLPRIRIFPPSPSGECSRVFDEDDISAPDSSALHPCYKTILSISLSSLLLSPSFSPSLQ